MNPELPQVRPSAEVMPQIPGGVEYFPDGTRRTVESRPTYSPEQQSTRPEAAPQPAPVAPPIDTAQVVLPQVPQPAPVVPGVSGVADAPLIAADDDLLEKEWVDKVKKIIALTKGNPHEQARSIAALQADYLKKRYNRTVGESDSAQMAG